MLLLINSTRLLALAPLAKGDVMEYISGKELSNRIGVPVPTLYNWRQKGCPQMKGIRMVRYNYDEVVAWIRSQGGENGLDKG